MDHASADGVRSQPNFLSVHIPPESCRLDVGTCLSSGDDDFYVDSLNTAVLVHNCTEPGMPRLHAHYPNQRDALSAALHDAGITDRDLAITDYYDGGIQMLDPRGEPWQVIEGFDRSGGHFLTVLLQERRPSAGQFFKIEDSKMSGISCQLTGLTWLTIMEFLRARGADLRVPGFASVNVCTNPGS